MSAILKPIGVQFKSAIVPLYSESSARVVGFGFQQDAAGRLPPDL